jgi:hypothetical protein
VETPEKWANTKKKNLPKSSWLHPSKTISNLILTTQSHKIAIKRQNHLVKIGMETNKKMKMSKKVQKIKIWRTSKSKLTLKPIRGSET